MTFVRGKAHGVALFWDKKKAVKYKAIFRHGVLYKLFKDGLPKPVFQIIKGKRHGLFIQWNWYQKFKSSNVMPGILDGMNWYWQGEKYIEGNYIHGKKHGKFLYRAEPGR